MSHWEAEYADALKELGEANACNAALFKTVLANQRSLVSVHALMSRHNLTSEAEGREYAYDTIGRGAYISEGRV